MGELTALLEEGQRQINICNACRYCEGYCAVFPALERVPFKTEGDLAYLASLCHDCRACYQACMYTAPHEFDLNIPALMSEARVASYKDYARPRFVAKLFECGVAGMALILALAIAVSVALYEIVGSSGAIWGTSTGPDSLYRVVDHAAMAVPALVLSVGILFVCGWGFVAFMRSSGASWGEVISIRNWVRAATEAATLRWLQGGGGDCFYPADQESSAARRRIHHVVAYGFLLAFAATVSAAFYEYALHEDPPYGLASVPVVLGTIGGVAVIAGASAFLILDRRNRSSPENNPPSMDAAFLVALIVVSATGIALLIADAVRGEVHIVVLVHLGAVLGFYLTIPYGKLVHAIYRFAAIARNKSLGG